MLSGILINAAVRPTNQPTMRLQHQQYEHFEMLECDVSITAAAAAAAIIIIITFISININTLLSTQTQLTVSTLKSCVSLILMLLGHKMAKQVATATK